MRKRKSNVALFIPFLSEADITLTVQWAAPSFQHAIVLLTHECSGLFEPSIN